MFLMNSYAFGGLRSFASLLADIDALRNVAGADFSKINRFADAFYDQTGINASSSTNEKFVPLQSEVSTTVARSPVTVDDANNTSWTWRTVIPSSSIMKSGTKVRFKLSAHSTNGATMVAYFGQQDPSGDPYDFLSGNKIQLSYLGSTTIVIPAGAGEVWSDPVTYTLDNTKNHVFSCHLSTGFTRRDAAFTTIAGWVGYAKNTGGDAATDNATGYSSSQYPKTLNEIAVLENDYKRPDPQYKNSGGYGNRTSSITVTSTVAWDSPYNVLSAVVDGDRTTLALDYPNAGATAGQYLRFDFGSGVKKYITEFTCYTQHGGSGSTWGTWKWQGSDNASSWDDISSGFEWLADTATRQYPGISPRSEGYRYYQLICVTPGIANDFIMEIEFRIADGAITASYAGNYYDATLTATVPTGLSSPVVGQGTGGASNLNERYVIPYTQLSSGKKGRISFNGGTNIFRITGAVIALKATSGDPSDFEQATMVEMTFDGGNKRRDTPASSGVWYSDEFNFDFDYAIANSRDVVISFGTEVGTNKGDTFTGSGVSGYRVTGSANYNIGDAPAGSSITTQRFFLNSFEILDTTNLDLRTIADTAAASPSKARILAVYQAIDSATENTDYELYVSRNNESNWTEVATYTQGGLAGGNIGGSWNYIYGEVDLTGQPSGTQIVGRMLNKNTKDVRYAGVAVSYY